MRRSICLMSSHMQQQGDMLRSIDETDRKTVAGKVDPVPVGHTSLLLCASYLKLMTPFMAAHSVHVFIALITKHELHIRSRSCWQARASRPSY